MFYLSMGENAALAQKVVQNRQVNLKLYNSKGLIYDSSLEPLAGGQDCYYLVIDPRRFDYQNANKLIACCEINEQSFKEKLKKETPFVIKCSDYSMQLDGVVAYEGVSRYSGLASHLLGYLDGENQVGLSGIEKEFDAFLSLFSSSVMVEYEADALNGIIPEEGLSDAKGDETQNGIVLTLDQELCKALEESMDRHIEKGAAVVMNCKTGEIKALCSRPIYNEDQIAEYLDSEDGELINRALTAQTVGSVFKIILAACALEQGLENFSHKCTGGIMISGKTISCHQTSGHGDLNLKEAFAHSCNSYFIALGQVLGGERIVEMASRFGFGSSIKICGGILAGKGILPTNAAGVALANLSIGQGSLMASPIQVAQMTAIVANDGVLAQPNLYKGIYLNGTLKKRIEQSESKQIISNDHAKMLREFCVETIEKGTGKEAKPTIGSAGGKTSSAETGIIQEGREQLNVYFTGFYPADNPQYVITVFAENGISGGKTCGPVFREVSDFIAENFLTP